VVGHALSPARRGRHLSEFRGWTGDFQAYFIGLKLDNSKSYFEAHRKQYEQDVKAPFTALLGVLEPEFGAAKITRPNRDIRFSADKSPYKTNIYADCRGGYVALDSDGLVAAGGRYMMEPADLARFRAAVAADRSGAALAKIVDTLRAGGYEIGGQELKRVPPPHPQDHPRGELLRHKRLIYWKRWPVGPWLATAEPRERVAQVWRDGAALNSWFAKYLQD
jgi:uncharacterized protein (TIGR02453 family)